MDLVLERRLVPVAHPVLVMTLAGWGDASGAASRAGERLAVDADLLVEFDRDELFDFRSNRPVVHFAGGELEEMEWPELRIHARRTADVDLLVLTGTEPDFRWGRLGGALVRLAAELGVEEVVTLGAVPAPVPHTRPIRIVAAASDPSMLAEGDEPLTSDLVVPAAAVTVLRQRLSEAGLPSVGYWAQVPHYLGSPFHAGTLALLRRVAGRYRLELDLADLEDEAVRQRAELDEIVAGREDARTYVARLERMYDESRPTPRLEDLPSGDDLVAEIERFLRAASGNGSRPSAEDGDEESEEGQDGGHGDHRPHRPGEAPDG